MVLRIGHLFTDDTIIGTCTNACIKTCLKVSRVGGPESHPRMGHDDRARPYKEPLTGEAAVA